MCELSSNPKRQLNIFEAICLIAGAGIGGGVMALPYLVVNTGVFPAVLIMLLAYAVTVVLHIMIAELSIRSNYSSELLSAFSQHLFGNRKLLRGIFYALMLVTLMCNLAAYVAGAGDILADLLGIPVVVAEVLFFVCAASVVFLGLKRVATNEAVTLLVMLAFLAILVVNSTLLPTHQPLPPTQWEPSALLAVYGMAMFSLSSLFAVPQAASGLRGSGGRLTESFEATLPLSSALGRKRREQQGSLEATLPAPTALAARKSRRRLLLAVALGLLTNLLVMIVVVLCTLLSSEQVTEVAIVGWAAALGGSTRGFGSLFITFAMLGTYWSISLQLSDMTREFTRLGRIFSWLIATMPSFLLALLPMAGFLELMQIAGGATAVVVACMAVPAYLNATRNVAPENKADDDTRDEDFDGGTKGEKNEPGAARSIERRELLLGKLGKSRILCGVIVLMYLLMALGSLL